jgi:hypothetical protein
MKKFLSSEINLSKAFLRRILPGSVSRSSTHPPNPSPAAFVILEKNSHSQGERDRRCLMLHHAVPLEIKMTCARTQPASESLKAGGVCQPSTIDGINNAKWSSLLLPVIPFERERERAKAPPVDYLFRAMPTSIASQ